MLWKYLNEFNIYPKGVVKSLPEYLYEPNDINNFFLQFSGGVKCVDNDLL